MSTIGRAHRAAGVVDPTATETVKLALKEMGRSVSGRQTQARGLVWSEIAQFLEFDVRHLRDIRDRALVAVAYDTMCRREELVNLRIEDIEPAGDGSGTVVIRRSKTDTAGEGATAYLSVLSMRLVAEWLQASRRKSGTLFARVLGKDAAGDGFTAQNVTSVLRKVGRWIGLPAEEVLRISWAFVPRGRRSRSSGAEYRYGFGDAGRQMEGYKNADALWRTRPCCTWRNGPGCQATRTRMIVGTGSGNGIGRAMAEIPGGGMGERRKSRILTKCQDADANARA